MVDRVAGFVRLHSERPTHPNRAIRMLTVQFDGKNISITFANILLFTFSDYGLASSFFLISSTPEITWDAIIPHLPGFLFHLGTKHYLNKLLGQQHAFDQHAQVLLAKYPAICRISPPRVYSRNNPNAFLLDGLITSDKILSAIDKPLGQYLDTIHSIIDILPQPLAEEIVPQIEFSVAGAPMMLVEYGVAHAVVRALAAYNPSSPPKPYDGYKRALAAYHNAALQDKYPRACVFEPRITKKYDIVVTCGLSFDDVEKYLESL